jgi:hypothetical protein
LKIIKYRQCDSSECGYITEDVNVNVCPNCNNTVMEIKTEKESEGTFDDISLFVGSIFEGLISIIKVIFFFLVIIVFLRGCNACSPAVHGGGIDYFINQTLGIELIKEK